MKSNKSKEVSFMIIEDNTEGITYFRNVFDTNGQPIPSDTSSIITDKVKAYENMPTIKREKILNEFIPEYLYTNDNTLYMHTWYFKRDTYKVNVSVYINPKLFFKYFTLKCRDIFGICPEIKYIDEYNVIYCGIGIKRCIIDILKKELNSENNAELSAWLLKQELDDM